MRATNYRLTNDEGDEANEDNKSNSLGHANESVTRVGMPMTRGPEGDDSDGFGTLVRITASR